MRQVVYVTSEYETKYRKYTFKSTETGHAQVNGNLKYDIVKAVWNGWYKHKAKGGGYDWTHTKIEIYIASFNDESRIPITKKKYSIEKTTDKKVETQIIENKKTLKRTYEEKNKTKESLYGKPLKIESKKEKQEIKEYKKETKKELIERLIKEERKNKKLMDDFMN
jgi:hypothetical protein